MSSFAYAETQYKVECYNGTVLFFEAIVDYDPDNPTYLNVGTPSGPDGKCFKGWFTLEEGGTRFDFKTTPITEDLTVYAQWGEHTSTDTRTVSNSCTEPEEITLTCSVCESTFKKTLPKRGHHILTRMKYHPHVPFMEQRLTFTVIMKAAEPFLKMRKVQSRLRRLRLNCRWQNIRRSWFPAGSHPVL